MLIGGTMSDSHKAGRTLKGKMWDTCAAHALRDTCDEYQPDTCTGGVFQRRSVREAGITDNATIHATCQQVSPRSSHGRMLPCGRRPSRRAHSAKSSRSVTQSRGIRMRVSKRSPSSRNVELWGRASRREGGCCGQQ